MSNQKRGILTIISGFSGAGKGTVVGRLLEKYPEKFKLSISATTRSPRNGEAHGVHYFFKSDEEFQQMIDENAFWNMHNMLNIPMGHLVSMWRRIWLPVMM